MGDEQPTIDEIVVGDTPEDWAEAGFTVDADGVCRIGAVRVRLIGKETGRGIRSWSLRGLPTSVTAIDGVATTSSTTAPAESATHPNGVTELDHVVLASSDGERTAAAISAATGLDVRRVRDTATYGAAMRQWFFRLGPVILELVAPADGDGSTPAGFFGLAMNVADLEALPARYGERMSDPKDAVQPGRRIASLRHKAFHLSVPIAFMTPEPPPA